MPLQYTFVVLLFVTLFVLSHGKPIRVILDTDIGTDFDDTWALMLILSRPDIYNVQLVQVSTYNTTKRGQIAALILDTVNRLDVPLAIGAYTGEQGVPQYSIAENYSFDTFVQKGGQLSYGTLMMESIMKSSTPDDPVAIIEIAPATSLGHVLLSNPGISKYCYCVAMSGSVYHGYRNSSTPSAEYNVVQNITSAQAMYNATWLLPLATAPLDTTVFMQFMATTPLGPGPYQDLLIANLTSDHIFASTLLANYEAWYNGGGKNYDAILPFTLTTGTSTLYDALAAYMTGVYGGWRRFGTTSKLKNNRPLLSEPTFPFVTTTGLPLLVTLDGHTILAPGSAQTVYPAYNFPDGMIIDINEIADDIISSIISAA